MRIYIFKSDANKELRAFAGDFGRQQAAVAFSSLARGGRDHARTRAAAQFRPSHHREGDQRAGLSALAHEAEGGMIGAASLSIISAWLRAAHLLRRPREATPL